MHPLAFCSLLLGLFQTWAITLGLEEWLHIHWSITLLMALAIAGTPILGSISAIFGAMVAWHWPLLTACIVFLRLYFSSWC